MSMELYDSCSKFRFPFKQILSFLCVCVCVCVMFFFLQNGHVGFMLSCYDAQLCYDSRTDTFQARYENIFVN